MRVFHLAAPGIDELQCARYFAAGVKVNPGETARRAFLRRSHAIDAVDARELATSCKEIRHLAQTTQSALELPRRYVLHSKIMFLMINDRRASIHLAKIAAGIPYTSIVHHFSEQFD
jgi:hypothetical protein